LKAPIGLPEKGRELFWAAFSLSMNPGCVFHFIQSFRLKSFHLKRRIVPPVWGAWTEYCLVFVGQVKRELWWTSVSILGDTNYSTAAPATVTDAMHPKPDTGPVQRVWVFDLFEDSPRRSGGLCRGPSSLYFDTPNSLPQSRVNFLRNWGILNEIYP